MVQYINKADVVAEIRKRLLPTIRDKHYGEWEEGQDSERIAILDIIDTIEVKDVDEIIKNAEDHAYFAGSEAMRVKFIEKACDWLRIELVNFEDYIGMGETFIEDFKNYMKGE